LEESTTRGKAVAGHSPIEHEQLVNEVGVGVTFRADGPVPSSGDYE
jgi:hypothetical protein